MLARPRRHDERRLGLAHPPRHFDPKIIAQLIRQRFAANRPKPLARRKIRSIPACAGEPTIPPSFPPEERVHPRVCGGASRVQTTELIQTLQCRLHIMECGMCGQPFYDVKQRLRYATK